MTPFFPETQRPTAEEFDSFSSEFVPNIQKKETV